MAARSRKKLQDDINRLPGEIERDKEKLKTLRGKERMAFQAAIKAKQETLKRMEQETMHLLPRCSRISIYANSSRKSLLEE